MNRIIFYLLLLTSINAYALPDCPSDQSVKRHNCFGSFYYENLDVYMGEWKDNKFHGQGTFAGSRGKFVGEWKEGKFHGQGSYTHNDGRKYEGEYKDNKKNGQGTHTWPNGQKYVGKWKDGKFHGQGTLTFADGNKESGLFYDGELIENKCKKFGFNIGTAYSKRCQEIMFDEYSKD